MPYYGAPREPAGGWKNDAQWIGNVQKWAEDMIRMGFDLKDVMKIYQDEIGEPFPKNLKNTIEGNDWLFPGQNAMYEYDLDNHMRRHFTYNDPEHPGQQKGPFEWEAMSEGEIAAVNQYFGWRDDPRNSWMFGATAENPEGHPYQAWLQQWGERWKDPNWTPPKAAGVATPTKDIFNRSGYDASGRPIKPNSGFGPLAPSPVTPGKEREREKPNKSMGTPGVVSTAQTSAPNLVGYGNPVPVKSSNNGGPSIASVTNTQGWGQLGLDPRKRKPSVLNTSSVNNPYFTF